MMVYDLYRILALRAWDRGQLELAHTYWDIAYDLIRAED